MLSDVRCPRALPFAVWHKAVPRNLGAQAYRTRTSDNIPHRLSDASTVDADVIAIEMCIQYHVISRPHLFKNKIPCPCLHTIVCLRMLKPGTLLHKSWQFYTRPLKRIAGDDIINVEAFGVTEQTTHPGFC